jgi:hypothetical protein
LVTLKGAAKLELFLSHPASVIASTNSNSRAAVTEAGLLNKSSRLAAAWGVTKFITIIVMKWVTFFGLA